MAAQSPEELEVLLEDALVLQDDAAVAALFADGGVLVERSGCVRGRSQVAHLLAQQDYLAAPCSVTVVSNVAIVVGPQTVNVSCRDPAGAGGWWPRSSQRLLNDGCVPGQPGAREQAERAATAEAERREARLVEHDCRLLAEFDQARLEAEWRQTEADLAEAIRSSTVGQAWINYGRRDAAQLPA